MKNLSTLNFYIRNIKVLSFLALLTGLGMTGLEIADYMSQMKVVSYSSSPSLETESSKLLTDMKRVHGNMSGILAQFGSDKPKLRKVDFYDSYRNTAELSSLKNELNEVGKDIASLKESLGLSLNIELDLIIKKLDEVIELYRSEGLIPPEEKIEESDFQPVYNEVALERVGEMRTTLDSMGTYFTELAAQMDKQENRDIAESFVRKLDILKNFVGSHQKKLDVKEKDMGIKVLQVRSDIFRMRNELRLSLTSHWAVEDQLKLVKDIANHEIEKADQSKKELENLSFRYLKEVLLLLALSFVIPFLMLLSADCLRLKIGESKNGA